MHLADLAHARVAIWGYGREGRAALAVLRKRFPEKALTLFCNEEEARTLAQELHHPGLRRNDEHRKCVMHEPQTFVDNALICAAPRS